MAVYVDSRNGTMVVDTDDENEAREILSAENDLDLDTFERVHRPHGTPLDCGCIPHVTRMGPVWGFYCETEDQPYCNFECSHDEDEELDLTARTVFALWHGGSSYSGDGMESLETFPSIAAAGDALRQRALLGHHYPQHFEYVNKPAEDALTPNADEGPSMTLYLGDDPTDVRDPYPDRLLTIGPRGGLRQEMC